MAGWRFFIVQNIRIKILLHIDIFQCRQEFRFVHENGNASAHGMVGVLNLESCQHMQTQYRRPQMILLVLWNSMKTVM